MSLIFSDKNNLLISHQQLINQIYQRSVGRSFAINKLCFEINSKYLRTNQKPQENGPNNKQGIVHETSRNRKKIYTKKKVIEIETNRERYELIKKIQLNAIEFMEKCKQHGRLQQDDKHSLVNDNNNEKALQFTKQIYETTVEINSFMGQNQLDSTIITNISDESYLIPPFCEFFSNNIDKLNDLLIVDGADHLYDFIVIDPPWWNKYIRRARQANKNCSYKMLDKPDIGNIPIEKLIKANTLVVIWCTNSPSHIAAIENEFLSKWNLKLLAKWYWVKITKFGETICDFGSPLQKQPFEHIFVACRADCDAEQFAHLDKFKCIFSVPSVIHSHKPPLIEIFKPYLPQKYKCLEIFARYLLPQFTSIGLEVLKLQNVKLYEEFKEK